MGKGKISCDDFVDFANFLGYHADRKQFLVYAAHFAKEYELSKNEFEQAICWLCKD